MAARPITGRGGGRTLDKWDFKNKGNANTAWPISKNDLDPYLARALEILELPEIPAERRFGDSGLNQIDFVLVATISAS